MCNAHVVNGAVLDILSQDPVWAAYAIADLRPDLARNCRWLVAPDANGLALLYFGLVPPVLLTTGSPEGVAAALTDADLPDELFLSILPSHLPAVKQHYQHLAPRNMVRMVLPQGRQVPDPNQLVRRLTRADECRLRALYRQGGDYAPDAFDPGQLEDGYFFGYRKWRRSPRCSRWDACCFSYRESVSDYRKLKPIQVLEPCRRNCLSRSSRNRKHLHKARLPRPGIRKRDHFQHFACPARRWIPCYRAERRRTEFGCPIHL